MRTTITDPRIALALGALLVAVSSPGCTEMSERIADESVGMNGGFEEVRSGLPVNWIVYSPSTIPTGDYELIVDRENFKEGSQALRFLVHDCSPDGGWGSPGIAQEVPAIPGASYSLGYWIKADGSEYQVSISGVDPKSGESLVIDRSEELAPAFRFVEHTFTMPEQFDTFRFELSIRSPGSVWIDGVTIERVDV